MNTFSNVQKEAKEAMGKYMDAFVELAKLTPGIEHADIVSLQRLSIYIKDNTELSVEVADGYRAVYVRVYDMIFNRKTKRPSNARPIKGVYEHRVNYRDYSSHISRRNRKLNSLEFDTHESAENFYNTLCDCISEYGVVTVGDVIDEYEKIYDTNDYTPTFSDYKRGWTSLPSKANDVIVRDGYSWKVVLPKLMDVLQ